MFSCFVFRCYLCNVGAKSFSGLMLYMPNLNKTSEPSCRNVNKVNSELRFLPLLWRFNPTEPVVEISVIL